jgi:DUF1680 family protein
VADGWAVIRRTWHPGDSVRLSLPMPVERVSMPARFLDYRGMVAVRRGPVLYCLEQVDAPNSTQLYQLPASTEFRVVRDPGILGGVPILRGVFEERLWLTALEITGFPDAFPDELALVPYGLWNNRGAGEMRVWFRESPDAASAQIPTT